MLYTEKIEELVKLTIASRYFKNETPVNLMLVCPPESGKTETLQQFSEIKGVYYTEDITYFNLIKETYAKIEKGEIKTIIIPDFLKIIEKNKGTARSITMALSQLCHDGVHNLSIGALNQKFEPPIFANLITGITCESYKQHKQLWRGYGFDTRFITVSYKYTNEQIDSIFDYIAEQKHIQKEMKKIDYVPREVSMTTEQIKTFQKVIRKIAEENGTYGFRLQKSFQTILKTSALLDGRNFVNDSDIVKIKHLLKYVNTNMNILQ